MVDAKSPESHERVLPLLINFIKKCILDMKTQAQKRCSHIND